MDTPWTFRLRNGQLQKKPTTTTVGSRSRWRRRPGFHSIWQRFRERDSTAIGEILNSPPVNERGQTALLSTTRSECQASCTRTPRLNRWVARTIEAWGGTYYSIGDRERPWPVGAYRVETARIRQLLALSARWHSRVAVQQFVSTDRDELLQAAISVGTASELILKALVSSTSPALLADRGDRDSLLLLANASLESTNALAFRSIAAAEVHRLAKHLHRALPIDLNDLAPLAARNAAAHLAIVDSGQLRRAVVQHCRIVQATLPLLELDDGPYWGASMRATVINLLDEAKSEVARVVAAKLAAATTALNTRVRALPEEARAAYLAALSGRMLSSTDHEEPQTCPACEQNGWLLCGVERGPVEYDSENGMAWASRTAYPFAFECPVCGLELENEELPEIPDFPDHVELDPDEDPIEARDWEPDEDLWRGR